MRLKSWTDDPPEIREYVSLARREGLRPSSIQEARRALLQYVSWLHRRGCPSVEAAGLKEFLSYRAHLLELPISKATVRNYLGRILSYYEFKLRSPDGERFAALCFRILDMRKMWGVYHAQKPHEPFSLGTVRALLQASKSYRQVRVFNRWVESEDYLLLMTLLYTGCRSSIYGLRVEELDFGKEEIRTKVKGGKIATIPLHPKLAALLANHLANRRYESEFVFRGARESTTIQGEHVNQVRAQRICNRVRLAAGIDERVYPYRFRKTLATRGRSMGLRLEQLQALLTHEDPFTTAAHYVTPDMSKLKRDFAAIDLNPEESGWPNESAARRLAPPGSERAWNMIVSGLWGLVRPEAPGLPAGDLASPSSTAQASLSRQRGK